LPEEEGGERLAQNSASGLGEAKTGIAVYPNPAQNSVNIYYKNGDDTPVVIELKDLLGKIIYTNFISVGKEEQISLQGYSNGVYILSLSRDKEVIYTNKLVKQE
jgi:hypothetical protein